MRIKHNDTWVNFHPKLQCTVIGVAYDFPSQTGRLIMTPGACCDMSGCIALFERIDPQVRRIETFSGDKPDTAYTYSFDEGKWSARRSLSCDVPSTLNTGDDCNGNHTPAL